MTEETQTYDVQQVVTQPPMLPQHDTSTTGLVLDAQNMGLMMKAAEMMAAGKATVPKHLQGSPSDCLAIIMQAMRWNMDPFVVAQKTHLVNGALGYEAQLVNAVVQASGAIDGRFHYEYQGDGPALMCRVGATIRGESEVTWGEWLALAEVKVQNSPLWKTNPRQQIGYLQVKNWARAFTPGAILGVYSVDELQESPGMRDVTPRTATDYAEQARAQAEPADPKERDALVHRLESAFRADGKPGLVAVWNDQMDKRQRTLVGIQERNRIMQMSPPVDVGPTFEDLKSRLDKAQDMDDVNQVRADCGHLPDEQRAEIEQLCEAYQNSLEG